MSDEAFVHRVRVGYADTDQGGIVHHSVYLRWLEQARVEHLRARGIVYRDMEYDDRFALPVVDASLKYRRPARFDEELDVRVWVGELGRASVRFDYEILRGGEPICEARIRLACISLPAGRPTRLPERVRAALL